MSEPIRITADDPIIAKLNFKRYRSSVERRVTPFLPKDDEPQTREIKTPWGATLTAKKGDMLVSEISTPDDFWPVDADIFEESYLISRPGYCIKSAVTLLVPLTEVTNGDPDQMVTVVSLEGEGTVRAGDFYLAKGVKNEIWAYPAAKIANAMVPID
jgi:hypothetical protein